jgi:hypothetical protein
MPVCTGINEDYRDPVQAQGLTEVYRGTFQFFILLGSFSTKKVQLLRKIGPWVRLEFNLGSRFDRDF